MKSLLSKIHEMLGLTGQSPGKASPIPSGISPREYLFRETLKDTPSGLRILEIGPKDGLDSARLASLAPSELVMLDIPANFTIDKTSNYRRPREEKPAWLDDITLDCKEYVQGNVLYLSTEQLSELGQFDLVWCTGVLYHNPEPLRFMRRLFDLLEVDGRLVIESSVTRNPNLLGENCIEVIWPKSEACLGVGENDDEPIPSLVSTMKNQSMGIQSNITHLPSRLAVLSFLEMVGFQEIEEIQFVEGRVAATAQKGNFNGHTYQNRGPSASPYLLGKSY